MEVRLITQIIDWGEYREIEEYTNPVIAIMLALFFVFAHQGMNYRPNELNRANEEHANGDDH